MTTLELLQYYGNLLIMQYLGQPRAHQTILQNVRNVLMPQVSTQQITIKATSGLFTLSYQGNSTPAWPYNSNDATIQGALRALPGLSQVTVVNGLVTFYGVDAPAELLISSNPVLCEVNETDLTLPLAVQNAYNLTMEPLAEGLQLDVLGKYVGVNRNGVNNLGPISLNDADFLTLIRFATVTNNSGSSLATIVQNLYQTFGTQIRVFDYKNMQLSYLINSSIGSQDLIQLLIDQDLLPRPLTVAISVIYASNTNNYFGFRTYQKAASVSKPFNTYTNYNLSWPWLSYTDAFTGTGFSLLTETGNNIVQENGDAIYLG